MQSGMLDEARDSSVAIFDAYMATKITETQMDPFLDAENLPIVAASCLVLAAKLHDCKCLLTTVCVTFNQIIQSIILTDIILIHRVVFRRILLNLLSNGNAKFYQK